MIKIIIDKIKDMFSRKTITTTKDVPVLEVIAKVKQQQLYFSTKETGVAVSRKLRRKAEKSF